MLKARITPIYPSNVPDLSDPKPPTNPLLEMTSGRADTVKPLTGNAYDLIEERRNKQEKQLQSMMKLQTQPDTNNLKLGFLFTRAKIPRVLAHKMADLTEGYYEQMCRLLDANDIDAAAPELEGNFEKSRIAAKRFEDAMQGIEKIYAKLRKDSQRTVAEGLKAIDRLSTDKTITNQLQNNLREKYEIDVNSSPKYTLLPLMKGKNVYKDKKDVLDYLLNSGTKENKSSERIDRKKTKHTVIEMTCQIQPKHKMSVFSDHAGFVAKFSYGDSALYVYYHSLEHGHQHTTTRMGLSYGSLPGLHVTLSRPDKFSPGKTYPVHEPRSAYVDKLRDYLFTDLIDKAQKNNAHLLFIIGECTRSIHERFEHLRRSVFDRKLVNYDYEFVNASPPKVNGKSKGLGVHALVAHVFKKPNSLVRFHVQAHLLTVEKKLDKHAKGSESVIYQNILSLEYGKEKHAFAHLLNGSEDDLAMGLVENGYVSVGGDLNNISIGTDLVATIDDTKRHLSMGSNSTGSKMYDKITLLPPKRSDEMPMAIKKVKGGSEK